MKLCLRSARSIRNGSLLAFCRCAGCGGVISAVIEVGSLHSTQMVARIPFAEDLNKDDYVANISRKIASSACFCPVFIFFHYDNRDTSYHKTSPSHPHISDTISQWCSQQKHIGLQLIRLHQSSIIEGQSSKMALRSFYVIHCFYRWLPRNHLRIFETDNFGVLKVKYKGGGMNANYAYPPKVQIIKGIKNGCPCIVEIRGTQGCALVGDPARAVGECRDVAKAQP